MYKKLFTVLAICAAMLASCSKGKQEPTKEELEAMNNATREELAQAVSDRDELLSLTTDIQQSISQIKELENIVTVTANETPDKRAQIKQDIAAIQQTLAERQARLEELEKKLASSNIYSNSLKGTIEALKKQISDQEQEIERLNNELNTAKQQITTLNTQVDSLNTTVANVSSQRDEYEQRATNLNNELNTCYYAIGSGKELKEHKILEGGFLRKTKIMKSDFDKSFFTTADKRSLTTIPLHSKKAQVMTNQPKESYAIIDNNGQKVLSITNPEKFWSLTNYLVIKID